MELRTVSMGQALKVDVTEGGVRLVEYQPGNGSGYHLLMVHVGAPFTEQHRLAVGFSTSTQYMVTLLGTGRSITLADSTAPIHYGYVKEKLGCSLSDAHVLAELLGYLTGRGSHAERPEIPADHVVHVTPAPLVVQCGNCHRKDSIPAVKVMAARPGSDLTFPIQHTCRECSVTNHFVVDLTTFEV